MGGSDGGYKFWDGVVVSPLLIPLVNLWFDGPTLGHSVDAYPDLVVFLFSLLPSPFLHGSTADRNHLAYPNRGLFSSFLPQMYFCLPLPVARLGILMYFVVVDRPILNTLTGVIEGEFNPGSLTQTVDLTPPGKNDAETVSDGCDQYIFVRYYNMHKRLGIPRVVKAGAGPHNLGSGAREDESSPKVEARSPVDSGSDSMSNTCDDGGGKDRSSVTSVEPGSETVIHNTAAVRSSSSLSIFALTCLL